MNRLTFFVIMLLSAAFFAVGGYFFYHQWHERNRVGTESVNWPTAPATATGGHAEFVDGSYSGRTDYRPYQPRLVYTYEVSGVTFTGDQIGATNPAFESREEALEYLDAYPKEGLVAHYNPEDPTEAVLETGIPWLWRLVLIVPFACALTSLFLLGTGIRGLVRGVPVTPKRAGGAGPGPGP
ncbi:MAG: DUF3592 domain-containing protein [Acidobacteriota bacterium]